MFEKIEIQRLADKVGFDACGVAPARFLSEDAPFFEAWLQGGYYGDMHYLAHHTEKRFDPSLLLHGCRSVVVCLLNYFSEAQQPDNALRIAKYAQATTDYHTVVRKKLEKLKTLLAQHYGEEAVYAGAQQLFCDTAPLFERRWAQVAGLGFIGKSKQFISPRFGTYVHIGVLLLQAEVDCYDEPCMQKCMGCNGCILQCPSGALSSTKPFDARRCISYLTTERKAPLTQGQSLLLTNVLVGCDICAACCPHNKVVTPHRHAELEPNGELLHMTAERWNSLSRRARQKLVNRLAKK